MRFKSKLVAAAVAIGLSSLTAYGAGLFQGLPIVGQGPYCTGASATPNTTTASGGGPTTTPTPTICNSPVYAGPFGLTGKELFPADTQLTQGQIPQTVYIPSGLMNPAGIYQGAYNAYKNVLRNGDISVNPFQMGTSQASNISNTITTSADGFRMLGGASSAIQWSSQTGATDIVANQFTKSLRFQRASGNTNTAAICEINVLTSQDSTPLQGQNFVYSFWAKPGANFSPTSGNIAITVAYGTGSDQSAANFNAGSWTGQANAITAGNSSVFTTTNGPINLLQGQTNIIAQNFPQTVATFPVSVTSGVATAQTLPSGQTAQWVQYWVSGSIPATATQVGTQICWTPVGTAGTNDWIETSNHQLEIVGPGVITPTAFDHHTAQQDLTVAGRFLTTLSEPASGVQVNVTGNSTSATAAAMVYPFPVQMRAAPTFVALGTALSGSTWTNKCGNVNNALATTFIVTATANTVNNASMTVTSSGSTIGFGCELVGAGGGSILSWTAEL